MTLKSVWRWTPDYYRKYMEKIIHYILIGKQNMYIYKQQNNNLNDSAGKYNFNVINTSLVLISKYIERILRSHDATQVLRKRRAAKP